MSYALSRRAAIEPPRSNVAVRVIVLVTVALNLAGFFVYKKLQRREQAAAAAVATAQPEARALTPGVPVEQPAPPPAPVPERDAKADLARAHRASGLAALESGDYELAVKSFTTVLKLSGNDSDATELLRIAKDLQERAKEAAKREAIQAASAAGAPTSEPTVDAKKAEPARSKVAPKPQPRSSTRRTAAVAVREPEAEVPAEGLLLVTSSPSGLLVEVDGRSMDLTPAKVRLEPGVHTVALLRGSQRLHERRVEISADGVHSVDVDVTGALRAAQAFARERIVEEDPFEPVDDPTPPSPAERNVQAAAAVAPAAQPKPAAPAPAPVITASATASAQTAAGYGDLHVVSPSIYGDVWINGRAYGPPPVLAKRVGAGPATVEIKVGGTARRTKTVNVLANQRVTLRIR